MPKGIPFSDDVKRQVIALYQQGHTSRTISELLTGVSARTVRRIVGEHRRDTIQVNPESPYVADTLPEKQERFASSFEMTPTEVKYEAGVQGDPATILRGKGLDPDKYQIDRVYGRTLKDGTETFGFSASPKADAPAGADEPWDSLKDWVPKRAPVTTRSEEPSAFFLDIADNQIGKARNVQQVEEQLDLIFQRIDRAYDSFSFNAQRYDIDVIAIGWLGDHIEGFVSQGGNSAWRTQMPLTTQIQIMRRIMRHAMLTFADAGVPLKMISVPGNHGEAVRFGGTGTTTYTDSHDTDCLIALWEDAKTNPHLQHVEFLTPQDDELSVVVNLAGTYHLYNHGHKCRQHKHMEWWQGQSFATDSPVHQATVAHFGHYHHFEVMTSGNRTAIIAPANEVESQWWKHQTGESDRGGIVCGVTTNGSVVQLEVIR